MDVGWGTDGHWDARPGLDEFLLARIAEDNRVAVDAAQASGRDEWDDAPDGAPSARPAAEHVTRHDPARVRAECTAKRQMVLSCREVRPDMHFLGTRPNGMADFTLTPRDPHQLAALTLALLALPYRDHHDYRSEWRP